VVFSWRSSSRARLGRSCCWMQSGPLFALLHTHHTVPRVPKAGTGSAQQHSCS
jgi:hypothetical protein